MEAKVFNPTPEMLHIQHLYTSTRDNIIVNSYAGTGKTTLAEQLISATPPSKQVLYLVFTKKNKEEAEARFAEKVAEGHIMAPLLIRNLNGFGFGVWQETLGRKFGVNQKKTYELFNGLVEGFKRPQKDEAFAQYSEIKSAVGFAKSLGYIPDDKFQDAHHLIRRDAFFNQFEERLSSFAMRIVDELLTRSIAASYDGNIDFDDQNYMPALFGGKFPRFPEVIGDEFQDFNPVNHELCAKLIARGARLTAVGDPYQSIYVFRGAMRGGMAIAAKRFNMTKATLSVSFRCPEAIVRGVHWRVPDMKWYKHGGVDRALGPTNINNIPDGSAIICRNNAPLFALALRVLAMGRGVSVSGSEIGPKITGIMKKFGPLSLRQEEVLAKIQTWLEAKLAKESTTAQDTADCMRVFASRGETLGLAIAYVEDLFARRGPLTLITGHKAKGLEWDRVYHLDPNLCNDSDQDQNLRYVIKTRSLAEYYEITTEDINDAAEQH